jgi:cytochrome c oxidase cbb3-type subunit 3
MSAARLVLLVGCALAACLVQGCEREARRFQSSLPAPAASVPPSERTSSLQPATAQEGGVRLSARTDSPYEGNAYAVSQGKRLFRWYNCSGCHAGGGGSMGPALMDSEWKYGSEPAAIYASIMQGRPQGMPSFGGHIPEDQVWQLVAYVRSMSGQLGKDVAPSRSDSLSGGAPESARQRAGPFRAASEPGVRP